MTRTTTAQTAEKIDALQNEIAELKTELQALTAQLKSSSSNQANEPPGQQTEHTKSVSESPLEKNATPTEEDPIAIIQQKLKEQLGPLGDIEDASLEKAKAQIQAHPFLTLAAGVAFGLILSKLLSTGEKKEHCHE